MFHKWLSAAGITDCNLLLRLMIFSSLGFLLIFSEPKTLLAQTEQDQKPPGSSKSDSNTEIDKNQPVKKDTGSEPVVEQKQSDENELKSAEETEPAEKEPVKDNEVVKKAPHDDIVYPPIKRDLSTLPFPVRRMRELILEAAISGDVEKLRPLIGYGDDVTMLSLGGIEEDPIEFLKTLAGDDQGHEILAILAEVLEAGFVHMDEGTENELYVWPYFVAWPLDKLTPKQRVELYRLVTHGDYEDMESFGAYIFYRLGITPRGRWRFFVAGD